MENLKNYIRSITDFSDESWAILSECLSEQHFTKGKVLLSEGQVCNAIFFISKGYCKASYNKDGRAVNTAFYFENDFATNTKSLTSGNPSEYEIKACERLQVVRFDKIKLLDAYKQSWEIETLGRKILEMLFAKQEEHSDGFKLLTPQQRYEQLMLKYPDFLQRISLTQIASFLGISRETLSRIRGR